MVGNIVWAPFPFTNLTQTKRRPVLVLADVASGRERDWIVCEITSSRAEQTRSIAISHSDMEGGELHRPNSRVRPDRLMTLNESLMGTAIARLTDAKLAEILASVRRLF